MGRRRRRRRRRRREQRHASKEGVRCKESRERTLSLSHVSARSYIYPRGAFSWHPSQ
jgi:hypothetical protein